MNQIKAKRIEKVMLDARLNKSSDRERVAELVNIYNKPASEINLNIYFTTSFQANESISIGDAIRINMDIAPLYWKGIYCKLFAFYNVNYNDDN